MATLVVNNISFNYPDPGSDPGWGGDATDWAKEVTTVLATLLGTNDIIQTSALIANNQTVSTDVVNLFFDPYSTRAANISYSVYRRSDTNTSGVVESGTIYLTYDNSAGAGDKWILAQVNEGSCGVYFNITDAGQVQYQSSDIGSTNYIGQIKFSAKVLDQ